MHRAMLEFEIKLQKRQKKGNNKIVKILTEELAELDRKEKEKKQQRKQQPKK
jgi:hypothetical protein